GISVMIRDITERKQAEEALRDSELRLRSVTKTANDAIVSADSRGVLIAWNKGAHSIFGYTPDEVIGQPLTMLMPERYRDAHRKGLERFLSTGETRVIGKTVELGGLRKDGTEFPLELSLSNWTAKGGPFFTAIIRDITERKSLEAQLRQSQKIEAIGQLTGGIAHDFNNVLTVINGYSELMLLSLPVEHPHCATFEQIRQAGEKASRLMRQLLAFSRQ